MILLKLAVACGYLLTAPNPVTGCQTPDDKQGECKPIKECSVLYSLLDNTLNNQTKLYLRRSLCGGGNTANPRVCCPSKAPWEPTVTGCKTPHDREGQCKPIKECPFLYSLLDKLNDQTRTYLKESRCNGFGNKTNPNVCCPSEAPDFDDPTRRQQELSCQTSDGQNGVCRTTDKCPSSLPLFGNNVLTTTRCGNSKVCCPITSSVSIPHNNFLPDRSECGISTEDKIIGGDETNLDEFTWMVLLQHESKNGTRWFGCGGSLISKRYVLTARHCLLRTLKSVRLGEWKISTNPDCVTDKYGTECAPKVLDIPIEEQIPYRDKTSFSNDIALLRLSREVEFGDFLNPVCLPTTPDELAMSFDGKQLVVAGWGRTERKKQSNVKLKVLLPVVPLSQCEAAFREAFHTDEITLQESQICAGGKKGKDACNGDSGGPLMHRGPRWYIAGIVSFGPNNPCGQEDRPAVFVKVANYVPWIINNVKP